jgi:hypothetical protein
MTTQTLFLTYGGWIAFLMLALAAIGFAVLYWLPKYYICSQCCEDFKPSRRQRAMNLLFGPELNHLCPACECCDTVLNRDRETLPPAADANHERDGGANKCSRVG